MRNSPLIFAAVGFISFSALLNAQQTYDVTVHQGLPQGVNPTYGPALMQEQLGYQRARADREQQAADARKKADEIKNLEISETLGDLDAQRIQEFNAVYAKLKGKVPDQEIIGALAPLYVQRDYSDGFRPDMEKALNIINKVHNNDPWHQQQEPTVDSIKFKDKAIRALKILLPELNARGVAEKPTLPTTTQ